MYTCNTCYNWVAGRPALGVTGELAWCWTTGRVQRTCTCRMQFTFKTTGLLGVNKKLKLVWKNWKQRWSSLSYKKVQFKYFCLPGKASCPPDKNINGTPAVQTIFNQMSISLGLLKHKKVPYNNGRQLWKLQRRWCAENLAKNSQN